ncbi:MAG: hypothetical protein ABI353_05000, partial [Isosphaeraceae bacterium]
GTVASPLAPLKPRSSIYTTWDAGNLFGAKIKVKGTMRTGRCGHEVSIYVDRQKTFKVHADSTDSANVVPIFKESCENRRSVWPCQELETKSTTALTARTAWFMVQRATRID